MRALFTHIDRIKQKPHDVRRQIALALAFGLTAFVAAVWFVAVVSTGTFAIQGASFADSTKSGAELVASPAASESSLLGAASAAFGYDQGPARIEIVSSETSSTMSDKNEPQAEQTVIPF